MHLQVQYYDSLNTLVLFILLGIGADGLFVYFDAFRQSEMHPEHCATLRARITYTVERAAQATLVTSFTTASSFLATYVSRIIPVAAFGVFAFTCMVMLYLATTLLIPPALVIWHTNFALLPFGVCSKRCPCIDREDVRVQLPPLDMLCSCLHASSCAGHWRGRPGTETSHQRQRLWCSLKRDWSSAASRAHGGGNSATPSLWSTRCPQSTSTGT